MNGSSIGDVLGSPAVAALINAYGSLLTTPRVQGRGAALGHALLGGVEGFQTAQQAQALAPLRQAMTQQAQARVPQLQAQTAMEQQQTKALQEDQAWREQAIKQLDTDPAFKGMDPQQKFMLQMGIRERHIDPSAFGLTQYQKGELDVRQQALQAQRAHYAAEREHWRSLEGEKGAVTDSEAFRAYTSARSRWDTGVAALDPSIPVPGYLQSFDAYKRVMGVGGTASPSPAPAASGAPSAPSRPGGRKTAAGLPPGAVGTVPRGKYRPGTTYVKGGRTYRVDGDGNVFPVNGGAGAGM